MKYKCCVCESLFNGKEIQDDFKNGVQEGFLCPKCGANIKDNMFEGISLDRSTIKTQIISASLVFLFTFLSSQSKYIGSYIGVNKWVVFGFTTFIFTIIYAMANKIHFKDIKNNVTTTQSVNA